MEDITGSTWKKYIKNGYRIFLGTGAACPHKLIDLFLESARYFNDLEFINMLSMGRAPWAGPEYEHTLHVIRSDH